MINLSVQLHTILQRQTTEGRVSQLQVSLPQGSTLAGLLAHLEIDLDPDALLLVVNGRLAELDHPLQEGDHVNLMPAISGG
jgi:sulfur carrier protein ThiS